MNDTGARKLQAIKVLLPGLNAPWEGGGLQIAQRLAALLNHHYSTEIVTYKRQEQGYSHFEKDRRSFQPNSLYFITWGPHINQLLRLLNPNPVVYYAQSFGWDIKLPPSVPIFCVSRYVLARWTKKAPHNPIFLLPPVIAEECRNQNLKRDIDVLIAERKSSRYLLHQLVPRLAQRCHVVVLKEFLPQREFFQLLNRSKIYLYASDAKLSSGSVEGFGLQPLEAILCGCRVFSNLYGGLSDYLEPALNMHTLGTFSVEYDMKGILDCLQPEFSEEYQNHVSALCRYYSQEAFHARVTPIFQTVESFFSAIQGFELEKNNQKYRHNFFLGEDWLKKFVKAFFN